MDTSEIILEHIRESVGLTKDNTEFDTELLNYINLSVVKINQNGVKLNIDKIDSKTTWDELLDPSAEGYESTGALPTFMALNVKLLFDPPPPSSVDFHVRTMDETLWRLKLAYEEEAKE